MAEHQFASLDYDVPVPSLTSNRHDELPQCDSSPCLVASMIRLNVILYDIIILNTQVVAKQYAEVVDRERERELTLTLDHWYHALPPRLHYSDENWAYWVGENFGPIYLSLHINYNHAGQLLLYKHLHPAQDTDQDHFGVDATSNAAQRCKRHATNLCDLIHRANQHPETVVMYPLAGHILCLASTVQIHTLLFGDNDRELSEAKARLEHNFNIILSMNHFWPVNQRSINRLQIFHNACLRDQDDSFRLDAWMLRFMLGFTQDIEDRDAVTLENTGSSQLISDLKNLLDI